MTTPARHELALSLDSRSRVSTSPSGAPGSLYLPRIMQYMGDHVVVRVTVVDGEGEPVAIESGSEFYFAATADHDSAVAWATDAEFAADAFHDPAAGLLSFSLDLSTDELADALYARVNRKLSNELWVREPGRYWTCLGVWDTLAVSMTPPSDEESIESASSESWQSSSSMSSSSMSSMSSDSSGSSASSLSSESSLSSQSSLSSESSVSSQSSVSSDSSGSSQSSSSSSQT